MITIYHNPRCSKSRQGLALLEESGKKFSVVKYLDDPLSLEQLQYIVTILGITPIELVRQGEPIWKSTYKGKELTNQEVLQAMIMHPKLIERPIVINGKQGIIGRPPENINSIL